MSIIAIEQYITTRLPGATRLESAGYIFYFYGQEQMMPFLTLATADQEGDRDSNLDREGVYRVNIGLPKEQYQGLLPHTGAAPDYTALNVWMPHPHYAKQYYVCILNPEGDNLSRSFGLIDAAYNLAQKRYEKKHGGSGSIPGI
ncbi:DUF6194 family protein [Taibaiella chishuiensis]|uniref:DUF6194 domain-containing protein n=1 Tax=Taibaiella chishuiensis TaxID=1434707 RepID=A0A2P8D1W0_9BACT|nr:DUF6194 family protein [Taibaiella chishuiensis]PSK91181.1 hypothetical protein B0I18_106193 [Taibaiella chishuiensis]